MPLLDEDKAFALLNSFQKQLDCYKELEGISAKQSALVKSGDEKSLHKLMVCKQEIIQNIAEETERFKQERELLDKTPMGEFSSLDEELDLVLMETEKVLKNLVESEAKDMEFLAGKSEEHQETMQHLGKGKKLAKAYLAPKKDGGVNIKG